MAYAEGTAVSVEKTVSELTSMIRKAGGAQIAQLDDHDRFVLAFSMSERQVRFTVSFDPPTHQRFAMKRVNQHYSQPATNQQRIDASAAHRRQRMRALLLVVKAKLESVESEVETFEEAFLANVVMSDGATVYDRVSQPIALEYQTGKPALMLEGPR
jgi:hypothetical protein